MKSFEGKLAVVTGGGSGIGRELVLQLAAARCSVAACDLNAASAAETAALAVAEGGGGRVTSHFCDVAAEDSVERLREDVRTAHGVDHLDLLFSNAGIAGAGSFVVDDRDAWERVFGICWGGVYNCARVFMPLLTASDEAWLVNTSSANGFWATHGTGSPSTAYATAKFAVKGFSEALIEDLRTNAPHVRVAVVMPGGVGTGINANSARALGDKDELAKLRETLTGLGLSLGDAGDTELRRLGNLVHDLAVEFAPTSAARAATIILDGVRAGRWRILVGADAEALDQAVRAEPEAAYDIDFPGLAVDWFMPVFALRTSFDSTSDPGLDASFDVGRAGDRIGIVAGRDELLVTRGAPLAADAVVDTDPDTFYAVLTGAQDLEAARDRGALVVKGDRHKLARLIEATSKRTISR